MLAAEVELREAKSAYDNGAWYQKPTAALRLRQAQRRHDQISMSIADAEAIDSGRKQADAGTRRRSNLD